MRDINTVLDTAKKVHQIGSDYKLAMYLGIGSGNLRNYRHGRSLPDPKVCSKLAAALGEKPDLLVVEMEAQRAQDDETRTLWVNLAKRLQAGVANCKLLAVLAIVSIAGAALPAWAAIGFVSCSVEQSVYYVKRTIKRIVLIWIEQLSANVKVCKAGQNVPRHPYPTASRPA